MSANADGRGARIHRYGLIGHPLAHSLSPFIQHAIMEALEIEGTYELFDVRQDEFEALLPRIFRQLDGFNVTIPYKEKVIPHLKECHASASRYGAVNTVRDGCGYNTDGAGFLSCGVPMAGRRVLLIGAGGVSRTMGYEAARAGAESIRILSLGMDKASRLASDIMEGTGHSDVAVTGSAGQAGRVDVILNGSPMGMWPHVRGVPAIPREIAGAASYLFDSVYNPPATRLLLHGATGGARTQGGLAMLFGQAIEAQKIWNPDLGWDRPEVREKLACIPAKLSRELVRRDTVKYLFTGFMGSGKTTVGRAVAEQIGLPFIDLDSRIHARAGKTIPEIFAEDGEALFRALEAGVLRDTLLEPGSAVVATGGGALLQPDAMKTVEEAPALVILLDASLEKILARVGFASGRPLLDGDAQAQAELLYRQRMPEYRARADLVVGNNGPKNAVRVADEIVKSLGFGEEGETV